MGGTRAALRHTAGHTLYAAGLPGVSLCVGRHVSSQNSRMTWRTWFAFRRFPASRVHPSHAQRAAGGVAAALPGKLARAASCGAPGLAFGVQRRALALIDPRTSRNSRGLQLGAIRQPTLDRIQQACTARADAVCMCARPHALAWAVPSMGPVSASANVAFPSVAVRSDAVLTIRNRDAVVKATAVSNCAQGGRTASVKQRWASTEGVLRMHAATQPRQPLQR